MSLYLTGWNLPNFHRNWLSIFSDKEIRTYCTYTCASPYDMMSLLPSLLRNIGNSETFSILWPLLISLIDLWFLSWFAVSRPLTVAYCKKSGFGNTLTDWLRQMNVIIAGGGVAGLTSAAVLRKLPFIKSILIFEAANLPQISSSVENQFPPRNEGEATTTSSRIRNGFHHYNGIWNPALRCLQSIGIYDQIEMDLYPVRESGYKDFSGRWLAQPTTGLQEPPSKLLLPLVTFFFLSKYLESTKFWIYSIEIRKHCR